MKKDTVEKIEDYKLINQDNTDDIKKQITKLILECLMNDIENHNYYLFDHEDYKLVFNEVYENISKKATKTNPELVLELAYEVVQRLRDISISNAKNCGFKLKSHYV